MAVKEFAITLDVDWAPDWCIEICAEILDKNNCKATFFITHQSPILESLESNSLFELGIHPNFLSNSSHGDDEDSILDHVLSVVPEAKSMRTHALVMSTPLLAKIGDNYEQIKTDVSALFFGQQNLQPQHEYFGAKRRKLTRLPYRWEDGVNADHPNRSWELPTVADFGTGLNIFNFHPVIIALNTTTLDSYIRLKSNLNGIPLDQAPESFFDVEKDPKGCKAYFEALCRLSDNAQALTIDELSASVQI